MKALLVLILFAAVSVPAADDQSDKSERCAQASKITLVGLIWWKRGGSRAELQKTMRPSDDVTDEESRWVSYWLDQSYITIASILAKQGRGHDIDPEDFEGAMFDMCMAK